jgi:hypothetical protein
VGAAGAVRQPRMRCVRQIAFAAVVTSGVSHSYCVMAEFGIDCCAMAESGMDMLRHVSILKSTQTLLELYVTSLSRHKPCGSCWSCATAAMAVYQADRFRCGHDLRVKPTDPALEAACTKYSG